MKPKHEIIFALLSEIITGICSHKDDLQIRMDSHSRTAFTLIVCPHMADYRKLVGKKGAIIDAFKNLTSVIGSNHGLSLNLDLQETEIGEPEPHEEKVEQCFNHNRLEYLVTEICEWAFGLDVQVEVEEITEDGKDKIVPFVNCPDDGQSLKVLGWINKVFYPYGKSNGRTVEVRLGNDQAQTRQ